MWLAATIYFRNKVNNKAFELDSALNLKPISTTKYVQATVIEFLNLISHIYKLGKIMESYLTLEFYSKNYSLD